jgi:ribosomal protein L29
MSKEGIENIVDLKKKLLSLRIKRSSGEAQDTSVFKKTKKGVARLYTKMNSKNKKKESKNDQE